MTSIRIIRFLVAPIMTALCFLGFVPKAEGATFTVLSGGSSFNGLNLSYYARNEESASTVQIECYSQQHRLNGATAYFSTDQNDPSEGLGLLIVSGRLNQPITPGSMTSGMDFEVGGVHYAHTANVQGSSPSWYGSYAFAQIHINPFRLLDANVSYYESTFEEVPGGPLITAFTMSMVFHGTFGPGEAGDALGRPFVPAPGTFGIATAAGLIGLRRRRAA